MRYLLDTNILSEARKGTRANAGVQQWFHANSLSLLAVSVVSLGEIHGGIERCRSHDLAQALALETWLLEVKEDFAGHILAVTEATAGFWGKVVALAQTRDNDAWIAATALEHDLTLVTRNTRDFERSGARLLNPFR
jgi:toxin FitB